MTIATSSNCRRLGMIAATCMYMLLGSQPSMAANGNQPKTGLIFEDDFSSGNLTKYNEYFRWGDGTGMMSAAYNIVDSTIGPSGSPLNALKFTYGTWQELRFSLTESSAERRASANAPSNVAYPEVWVSYDMFIPTNYYHSSAAGQGGNNNDKGWMTIWKDDYQSGPAHYRYEWRPTGDGGSYATLTDNAWGGNNQFLDFVRSTDLFNIDNGTGAYAIKISERGTWIKYTLRVRMTSSATANDGLAEVYKNGALAYRWDKISHWASDGIAAHAGFDRGYLMGYHNSLAPAGGATFYITNFKIGTTAASVGLGAAPQPPVSLHVQ